MPFIFTNSNTGNTTVNISIEKGDFYVPTVLYDEYMNVNILANNLCIEDRGDYTIYRNGHEAGEVFEGSEADVTCTENGGYDKVVYCSVCGEVSSTEFVVTKTATGHVEKDAVKENVVEATSTENGSYDEVVYCQVCGEELSRTPVEVAYVTEETVDETYENIDTENEEETESVTEEENETTSNPTTGDTIAVFITIFAVAVVGLATTLIIRKRIK